MWFGGVRGGHSGVEGVIVEGLVSRFDDADDLSGLDVHRT